MKLKDQEVGLMIVTIMEGLKKLDKLDDTVKIIYTKMITLLFNHFSYYIKDLKSVEDFTEEEKSFIINLPVLGVFLDPNSMPDGDKFKEIQIKDIPLNFFTEKSEVLPDNNPLHNILIKLPKEWFYDKDSLKKDIIKLLEQEDNEDRLKEIQDILNR